MKISSVLMITALLITTVAYAAQYDLRKITPEVQKALDGRRARFSELEKLKNLGKAGESNQGYVVNLSGDTGTNQVVARENQDRGIIYKAILEQNKLPQSNLVIIERVFGDTQRSKAKPGQQIQLEDGQWATKG